MIEQFIKFGIVGFSGLFVDFGTTWLFKERVGFNRYISNSIGFLLAATSNYIFNRIWTFGSTNPDIGLEYSLFLVISAIGLLINNIILYLFSEKITIPFFPKKEKLRFYLSKLIATATVTIWNFLMNYFFTFSL